MRNVSLALAALLTASPALAHEAPSGWSYDRGCCDTRDCRPAVPGEVTWTPQGWRVETEGAPDTVVPEGSRKVRQSGDMEFHVCRLPRTGWLMCVYVPPMGV